MARIVENFSSSSAKKIEAPDTLQIRSFLEKEILGQPDAVAFWADAIHRVLSGAPRIRQGPLMIITEVGPAGCGKTEIVSVAAKYLSAYSKTMTGKTPERDPLLMIECNNYIEEHESAKLVGSPPGYLGFSEPPLLAQDNVDQHAVQIGNDRSIGIMCFDEIESADKKINTRLMRLLDKGNIELADPAVAPTDVSNFMVVFTSNLGNKEIAKMKDERVLSAAEIAEIRHNAMLGHFTPPQLSRMGITKDNTGNAVVFNELPLDVVKKIILAKLSKLEKSWAEIGSPVEFLIEEPALDHIIRIGYSPDQGIRPLESIIDASISGKLVSLKKSSTPIPIEVRLVADDQIELYVPENTTTVSTDATINQQLEYVQPAPQPRKVREQSSNATQKGREGSSRSSESVADFSDLSEVTRNHPLFKTYLELNEQISSVGGNARATPQVFQQIRPIIEELQKIDRESKLPQVFKTLHNQIRTMNEELDGRPFDEAFPRRLAILIAIRDASEKGDLGSISYGRNLNKGIQSAGVGEYLDKTLYREVYFGIERNIKREVENMSVPETAQHLFKLFSPLKEKYPLIHEALTKSHYIEFLITRKIESYRAREDWRADIKKELDGIAEYFPDMHRSLIYKYQNWIKEFESHRQR